MNNIEERLWNYIDGTCTPGEQEAITALIAADERYRIKYGELCNLNKEFSQMELEEPSMAFTYNVMETIRNEQARQPLKAVIDKRIVMGIAAFFVFTITVLIVYVFVNINWTSADISRQAPAHFNFKLPELKNYFTSPVINGFLFFDVVLGLFLMDGYLRKKNIARQL